MRADSVAKSMNTDNDWYAPDCPCLSRIGRLDLRGGSCFSIFLDLDTD